MVQCIFQFSVAILFPAIGFIRVTVSVSRETILIYRAVTSSSAPIGEECVRIKKVKKDITYEVERCVFLFGMMNQPFHHPINHLSYNPCMLQQQQREIYCFKKGKKNFCLLGFFLLSTFKKGEPNQSTRKMTTRVVTADTAHTTTAKTKQNGTVIKESASKGPSLQYLVCNDPQNHSPFVNPREAKRVSSGKSSFSRSWPSRSTTPSWILNAIVLFDTLFVSWWIIHVLHAYHALIPIWIKRKITFAAWAGYVWIHDLVVCQWMGWYSDRSFYAGNSGALDKNPDANAPMSNEFKALSTLMYPVQLYPVNIPMIRFSLGQLNVVSLNDVPSEDHIERIYDVVEDEFVAPEAYHEQRRVSGLYVTHPDKKEATRNAPKKIFFWIYGGAYLGGDAEGNLSLSNEFVVDCDGDAAFIPSYRLAPEVGIDDVLWDICWSYRYLLKRLETEKHESGYEIVMVGISSGGALALRLLQFLRDRTSKLPMMPSFLEPLIDDSLEISARSSTRIVGAVLFAPYVDYRDPQPSKGSFLRNAKYDWVVTEAVQHYGLPYLEDFIPPVGEDLRSSERKNTNGRIQYSPLSHDMNDLPPLCLIASEHEACYDMTIEILNKARGKSSGKEKSPTDVTIGVWKYVCHVFSMMQALLPEGKASIEFSKQWIRTKTTN